MTFLRVSHAFLRQCFAQFILQQASQSEIQLSEMQLLCMNGGLELLPQRRWLSKLSHLTSMRGLHRGDQE